MGLSNDLISEFVKATKDTKTEKKETTLYGTVKKYMNQLYIQIDGSELLTPVSTTADMEDGERAMVQIKNHTAMIIGNVSSPSARTETVNTLSENVIEVKKVVANKVDTTVLEAEIARIDKLETDKLDATTANITYATIENLNAANAEISTLKTEKLDAETANVTYATIDFSNIKEAAIEKLFSDSGIIKDLIMSDGKVTGELVGVTIKGDLIEGNTLKADKLVILGEDGLYYKLNVNALGETTAKSDPKYQNGLDGSIIVAESITAEKIAVDDLVAFGATIGGFHINDHSLYSGAKNTANNTTPGIFLGDDGQVNFGDSNNYLKYYKDANNNYILEIAAKSIKFSTSDKTLEDTIADMEESINSDKTWVGTQEEYDAIEVKDPDTLYYITDDVSEYITESEFEVFDDAINQRVTSTETEITTVKEDVSDVESRVTDTETTITSLELTTGGLSASVSEIDKTIKETSDTLGNVTNDISSLSKKVDMQITSEQMTLAIQTELSNGVDKVKTSTGFRFDDEGITIEKTGATTSTNMDEDGMAVYKHTYDENNTKTEILTADSNGVSAYNLHAKTYLIISDLARLEKYTKNGEERIGCFWTG